jgi:hypothetical protein
MQFRVYQFEHLSNTRYEPRRLALSCNFLSSSSIIRETPSIKMDASHCHVISRLAVSITHETPGINWARLTVMQFRVYHFDHSWNIRYKPWRVALSCKNLVKTNQQVSITIYIFSPTLCIYCQIQRQGKSWLYILWSLPCVCITERIHIYFWVIAHARFNANNIFVNIWILIERRSG